MQETEFQLDKCRIVLNKITVNVCSMMFGCTYLQNKQTAFAVCKFLKVFATPESGATNAADLIRNAWRESD